MSAINSRPVRRCCERECETAGDRGEQTSSVALEVDERARHHRHVDRLPDRHQSTQGFEHGAALGGVAVGMDPKAFSRPLPPVGFVARVLSMFPVGEGFGECAHDREARSSAGTERVDGGGEFGEAGSERIGVFAV